MPAPGSSQSGANGRMGLPPSGNPPRSRSRNEPCMQPSSQNSTLDQDAAARHTHARGTQHIAGMDTAESHRSSTRSQRLNVRPPCPLRQHLTCSDLPVVTGVMPPTDAANTCLFCRHACLAWVHTGECGPPHRYPHTCRLPGSGGGKRVIRALKLSHYLVRTHAVQPVIFFRQFSGACAGSQAETRR